MKLEDQICSFELAKKLKELGVKQESLFCWYGFENPLFNIFKESDLDLWRIGELNPISKAGADWIYSAFTVAELGEILREFDIKNDKNLTIDSYNTYEFYNLVLKPTRAMDFESFYLKDSTEADVRAKMLIYLIENELIKL